MPLDFPPSPGLNQIYTFGGRSWIWNGSAWDSYNPNAEEVVDSVNGITGAITIAGSSGTGITNFGKTITVSNTGVLSFNGFTGEVQGVASATSGSGISITPSGGTGTITIVNAGVTGLQAGTAISVSSSTGNPVITNQGVQTFNGATGSIQGVSRINGLTGNIGLSAGTGITLTQSGNTFTIVATGISGVSSVSGLGSGISISPTTGAVVVQNTGVVSFNGSTGAVQGVASASAGSGVSITPTGGTGAITINNTGVTGLQSGSGISVTSATGNPIISNTGVTGIQAGSFITVTSNTGNITVNNTGVQTFNGATGAIQGVNLIVAGSGISVSPTGGTGNVTITNAGVTSINGSVGAISNVAFTNQGNTFSVAQIMNSGLSASGGVSFANQTFHGQTASFNGNIVLANNEFISNTVNGRVDFIPTPAGTTNFGTYIDGVTSGVGVRIGTIRTSDSTLNAGPIQFDPLVSFATGLSASGGVTFSGNVAMISTSSHTGLASFAGGISASGGVTFSGNVAMTSTSSHTGLADFGGGISAAGGTFGGQVRFLGGFTAGAGVGNCFMSFNPASSANNGGLWIQNGNLQLAGSAFSSGSGAFTYSPNSEVFNVYGQQYINQSFNYQAARVPLRLNAAPTQSVPIFAAYKQTVEGTALTATYSATNMVAGINENGVLFSTTGISTAGGTFTSNVQAATYTETSNTIRVTNNARSWFL